MTLDALSTDTNVRTPRFFEWSYRIPEPANETNGGNLNPQFFPLSIRLELIKPAWDVVQQIENRDIAEEAKRILLVIQDTLWSFGQFHLGLSSLPNIRAFNVEDGSLLLEWKFSDFRIGFSFEPDLQESGWYLVTNRKLGEISASGYITTIDPKMLVVWLFNFIFSNL